MIDFASEAMASNDTLSTLARKIVGEDSTTLFKVRTNNRRRALRALLATSSGMTVPNSNMSSIAFESANTVPYTVYEGYDQDTETFINTIWAKWSKSDFEQEAVSNMNPVKQQVEVRVIDRGYQKHILSSDVFGDDFDEDNFELSQTQPTVESESLEVVIIDKGYKRHKLTW